MPIWSAGGVQLQGGGGGGSSVVAGFAEELIVNYDLAGKSIGEFVQDVSGLDYDEIYIYGSEFVMSGDGMGVRLCYKCGGANKSTNTYYYENGGTQSTAFGQWGHDMVKSGSGLGHSNFFEAKLINPYRKGSSSQSPITTFKGIDKQSNYQVEGYLSANYVGDISHIRIGDTVGWGYTFTAGKITIVGRTYNTLT